MVSYLVDDVNELLKLQKGDTHRLNHIKELCENNELIPISERKYIERLANQYLHKKKPQTKKSTIFSSSNIQASQEKTIEPKSKNAKSIQFTKEDKVYVIGQKKEKEPFELTSRTKILLGIAAIALALIVITMVDFNLENNSIQEETKANSPISLTPPYLLIETDESSYQKADIISISGESNPVIDGIVRLTLNNPDGRVIWAENVQVKENGEFTTLVIAGGVGWEKSGKYILSASHEGLEDQISFDFIS